MSAYFLLISFRLPENKQSIHQEILYQKQGKVNVLDKRKAQIRNHASHQRQIQYLIKTQTI